MNALDGNRNIALSLALKDDNLGVIELLMDHGGIAPEHCGDDDMFA